MVDKLTFVRVLLVIVLGFLIYLPSQGGGFVLDDHLLIVENPYIQSFSHLPQFFTRNIAAGAGANWGFWRPLQMVSYQFDYLFWKLNPNGYHLTNTLLHVLVALCLWWLVASLFSDPTLAFVTSLLFVIHPLHSEAVSYISGRADSLAFVCMLLSLIFYIQHTRTRRRIMYWAALASFVAALLSRENSLVVPLLVILYHWTFKVRLRWKDVYAFGLIVFVYVIARLSVLQFQKPDSVGFLARLPSVFAAVTNYARLIIFPVGLHMEYGKKIFHWNQWQVAAGVIICAALLYAALRTRRSNKLAFFALAWIIVTLLPQLNLFYPLNAYMAEHWLYVPQAGVVLLCAAAFRDLYCKKTTAHLAIVFIVLLGVFYSAGSLWQNSLWSQPVTLYEYTLHKAPDSSRVMVYLGNERSQRGDYAGAITLYNKALAIDSSADACFNLANAYRMTGDNEDAISAYQHTIALQPLHCKAHYNLGGMYMLIRDYAQALAAYRKVLEIDPHNVQAQERIDLLSAGAQ